MDENITNSLVNSKTFCSFANQTNHFLIMSFTEHANEIFNQVIKDYHLTDNVDTPIHNPKRRIDRSNQDRTDLVEEIDSYFRQTYSHVKPEADAKLNTESPAWAVDRLSILALKIYHMQEQVDRKDASAEHIAKCQAKLDVLLEQQKDLSLAIDQLLEDIEAGRKYMKVYRQMKMYNDPATNPILYKK